VSAGSRHTFLIEGGGENAGRVQAAGFIESDFSYRGHLGLGPVDDCGPKGDPDKLCEGTNDPLPVTKVVDLDGELVDAPQFARVYAGAGVPSESGEMHALLISKDGRAYVSGNNNKGQLCLGTDTEYVDYFHEVKGFEGKAVRGAVGNEFTLILTSDGDVYGCGSNEIGQIGQGPNENISVEPVKIKELEGITDLATGLTFALFLNQDTGNIWGTGSNIHGQLCGFTNGNPTTVPQIFFRKQDSNVNADIIQVHANKESSYFLFSNGDVRACGRNDEGQLGNGNFLDTDEKDPIVKVKLNEDIVRLGSGPSSESVFFISDTSVWAAGQNYRYQLGIDEKGSRDTPVKVKFKGPIDVQFVSSSGTHTVANCGS